MQELYLQNLGATDGDDNNVDRGMAITQFPCVIGREKGCDYRIRHPMISRRHCSFFLRGDEVWLRDLGSRNRTFVNGELVQAARPLHEGDLVNLAHLFFFEVQMPKAVPPVQLEAAVQSPAASGRARHVLVVEDNKDAAKALAGLLTLWGHQVRVAHDGPEAIQAAEAEQPDTVLLDIRLPGMDGYEVAQQLRTRAGLEEARLVAITGYDPDRVHAQSEVGFDHLLTKPVDPEQLQEVLR
ncbi:MAG TPA: response regulator [Gemmataceae bacterium]|jgi:CheY-like chemotaxis protein|nr:response regulator [Gemmataceae bacterium]